MKCSGKTIFSAQVLNLLYFGTYIDNSISVTFHSLTPNKDGDLSYRPFLTPSVPAYEVRSLGKRPHNIIYIRDNGEYEDAIVALQDEGAIVPGSVQRISDSIVCAQLTDDVYNHEIIGNYDLARLNQGY